jgi:hypothetical protein
MAAQVMGICAFSKLTMSHWRDWSHASVVYIELLFAVLLMNSKLAMPVIMAEN